MLVVAASLSLGLACAVPALAEGYFKPSLELKNDVTNIWPKCFHKYLVAEVGFRSGVRNTVLEMSWLDDVQSTVAYRVAFPYLLRSEWGLGEGKLGLLALGMGSVSSGIKPRNIVGVSYSRNHGLSTHSSIEARMDIAVDVTDTSAVWVLPGLRISRALGHNTLFACINGMEPKDMATLSGDYGLVSVGADLQLADDSTLTVSMRKALGSSPRVEPWLDLRFGFGSMYAW